MRKNLLFILATLLLSVGYLNAQVMYSDDFESYTAGSGIADQEGVWWNTWSGTPGSTEDPTVSSAYAFAGVNSIMVSGVNDGVIEFPDYTTGRYRIEFYIMVPEGKLGYYNIMQNFVPSGTGLVWGMQVMLKNGIMTIDGAGYGAVEYNYTPGTWFKVQHFIDLNSDWVDMYIDDQLVHAYQWSKGVAGTGTLNKLDAFDFYAWDDNGSGTPEYYMDNFLIEQVETPYPAVNFAYTIENANDVVLTWEAPTTGTPESYSIARDGVVVGTTTDLTFTDIGVYPNIYDYTLLAFYGTSSGYSAPVGPLNVEIAGGNARDLVMYEIFTSVNCGYCPIAAGAMAEVVADGNDVAAIEYHISNFGADPFSIVSSDAREDYYEPFYDAASDGSLGYPGVIFNGEAAIEGALTDVAAMKELYMLYYNEQKSKPSVYTLNTWVEPMSTDPYTFNLHIDVAETFPYFTEEMRLIVALTETNIAYDWQTESQLDFVNRSMYPDANGTVLDFSVEPTYSTIIPVTIDPSYVVDNCELVIFIQKWDDGFIQQARKVELFTFVNADISKTFATTVFPNPANDLLNIIAPENINKIEVLNMAGQVISVLNSDSNNTNIEVSGFSTGVYFVKVYTQNQVTTHKVVVE
jgi:hypothetical protein